MHASSQTSDASIIDGIWFDMIRQWRNGVDEEKRRIVVLGLHPIRELLEGRNASLSPYFMLLSQTRFWRSFPSRFRKRRLRFPLTNVHSKRLSFYSVCFWNFTVMKRNVRMRNKTLFKLSNLQERAQKQFHCQKIHPSAPLLQSCRRRHFIGFGVLDATVSLLPSYQVDTGDEHVSRHVACRAHNRYYSLNKLFTMDRDWVEQHTFCPTHLVRVSARKRPPNGPERGRTLRRAFLPDGSVSWCRVDPPRRTERCFGTCVGIEWDGAPSRRGLPSAGRAPGSSSSPERRPPPPQTQLKPSATTSRPKSQSRASRSQSVRLGTPQNLT